MLRFSIVLCALLAACSSGDDWKPSRPGEIFRYTTIGSSVPFDSVLLGQPWKTASKYGANDGDTVTALPFGTFAGADAIAVHRDTNGIVTKVQFVYHARRDIKALVADYQISLGQPRTITIDTVAGAIRTTTRWQNDDTEFVIATISPPQKDDVGAMAWLIDRRTNRADPRPNEELSTSDSLRTTKLGVASPPWDS
jgi:hypothetical protein